MNIKEDKSRISLDDTQHVVPNNVKPFGYSLKSLSIKYDSDAEVF